MWTVLQHWGWDAFRASGSTFFWADLKQSHHGCCQGGGWGIHQLDLNLLLLPFFFAFYLSLPAFSSYLTLLCQWETCFMPWFAQQKQQTNCWIWQKEQGHYYVVHLSSSWPWQVCWQFFSLVKYRLKKRRRIVERVADKQCTLTATRNTKYCFSRLLEYAQMRERTLLSVQ